jgi:hypothetical protein
MHYSFFATNDSINVEYFRSGAGITSTNGTGTNGVGWTTLYKAGPSTAPMPSGPTAIGSTIGSNQNFALKTIDLTPILNRLATRDTFYIRFRYVGTQDFWWAIDNVKLVGKGGAPITWTPITGLFDNVACTNPYNPSVYNTTVYTKPTSSVTYTAISGTPNGCSKSASVTLNPRPLVSSVMTGNTTVCPNSTASISIALTGVAPWKFYVKNVTTNVQSALITANTTLSFPYYENYSIATPNTTGITITLPTASVDLLGQKIFFRRVNTQLAQINCSSINGLNNSASTVLLSTAQYNCEIVCLVNSATPTYGWYIIRQN